MFFIVSDEASFFTFKNVCVNYRRILLMHCDRAIFIKLFSELLVIVLIHQPSLPFVNTISPVIENSTGEIFENEGVYTEYWEIPNKISE